MKLYCVGIFSRHLICPFIMGMPLLNKAETPAKYRHQLQMLEIPTSGPPQLCGLGKPRRRLYCLANADRGFELDPIPRSCAQHRKFTSSGVESSTSVVQSADGGRSHRGGESDMLVVLGTYKSPRMMATFYVLDGLTCDLLLGKHFSQESISMFITLELNRRSLDPRARRSKVIPKP